MFLALMIMANNSLHQFDKSPSPLNFLAITVEASRDKDDGPLDVKVILKNKSKKDVVLKVGAEGPMVGLDFVVRQDARTIPTERYGDGFINPDPANEKDLVIKPGKEYVMLASLENVIPKDQRGPGTFSVIAFFYYDGQEIQSPAYILTIAKKDK